MVLLLFHLYKRVSVTQCSLFKIMNMEYISYTKGFGVSGSSRWTFISPHCLSNITESSSSLCSWTFTDNVTLFKDWEIQSCQQKKLKTLRRLCSIHGVACLSYHAVLRFVELSMLVISDAYCFCHVFLSTFSSFDNVPLACSQSSYLLSVSEQQRTDSVENRLSVSLSNKNLNVTPCGTFSNTASVFVDIHPHLGHPLLLLTLNIFFKRCIGVSLLTIMSFTISCCFYWNMDVLKRMLSWSNKVSIGL